MTDTEKSPMTQGDDLRTVVKSLILKLTPDECQQIIDMCKKRHQEETEDAQ